MTQQKKKSFTQRDNLFYAITIVFVFFFVSLQPDNTNLNNMKKIALVMLLLCFAIIGNAQQKEETLNFGNGFLKVTPVAQNAVRIQYYEKESNDVNLPDWLYEGRATAVNNCGLKVDINPQQQLLTISDESGTTVFTATKHSMQGTQAQLSFVSPKDEYLFGLGQFQDGYSNIRGLARRLTQVNTQISVPMMLSNKGYGILWNNYGLVDFNPADNSIALQANTTTASKKDIVDVTSTEGGKKEVRERDIFEGTLNIAEGGQYSLLLDVGQKMARRHNLVIDGAPVIEMQNLWLPPTASAIVTLSAGSHTVSAELSKGDRPTLFFKKVENESVFRSPIAAAVDYTVFVGTPDEVMETYRQLTGPAPLMPQWALGYIHCRERFHSSDEILQTGNQFRNKKMPVDVLVQDWQYWGKYGWNAMRFDEAYYPDPKALTDSLHKMNMRLMLSVWSKIDKRSEVGQQMMSNNYYIPNTDWIDFFNPTAATAYWKNFSERLVPLGIDAWWQDATEPENDDLLGRRVNNGLWAGEQVRNVYPLLVNKTVCEGLLQSLPQKRPMILTRCGFPGIQRYGSALWSGDIGNDWETFRRQIVAGLGLQAAGLPWWTYDAGGFFRPGNQYKDQAYIHRLMRWVETSVYLPLMRIHGYMSDTEPWRYGEEAEAVITKCLNERYRLLPYIYSNAAAVSFEGSTLMRPLVFDFSDDNRALEQKYEYMFGKSLLVSPVTAPDVTEWSTYLPVNAAGWYDFHTGKHYAGGQSIKTSVDNSYIPVFVKGGSILPYGPDRQYALEETTEPMEIRIYPGADADFILYEDDGYSTEYMNGQQSRIVLHWDNANNRLTIGARKGKYASSKIQKIKISVAGGAEKEIIYKGEKGVYSL